MHPVDPRAVGLWRLQGIVRALTFWLPVLLVASLMAAVRVGALITIAVAVPLALGIVGVALLVPPYAYARFRYGVRDSDLLVERGLLFRRTTSIPLDRIQHVDTRQGPIERALGLSQVVVYTAAGLSADGSIPALDERTAAALRDHLARRASRVDAERSDDGV